MRDKLRVKSNGVISLSGFTFLGLIAVFALQSIWLYNTYILIRNNIQKECYAIMEKSLEEEGNMRICLAPKGTEIYSGPTNDTIPAMTYFYEGLSNLGYHLSLHNLDSITSELLLKNGIEDKHSIYIRNLRTGETLDSIGYHSKDSWLTIKPKYFPIRKDYTQVVQIVIANPSQTFLERMGLLFIATAIILVLIISSIIYQIRIISRLKKIFKIREDFSHAMVHDMKTPLSTIYMALNFLHSGRLDDKPEMKDKYFKIAESEADHLLTLTNKVLTLSKLEKHKLEMVKEEIVLISMINKLTDKFTAKASKPVQFTVNLKATEVYADQEYLEEVISNLIDNAIKYSNETVDIQISSDSNESYTILKVYDNGFGIAKEDQSIIFNKYERASATKRNRKGGASGFGLGLNFAEQVITAHDGKIVVNSIEGEFTEFIIYLPKIIQ